MIKGVHTMFYSSKAEEAIALLSRAVFNSAHSRPPITLEQCGIGG